MDLDLNTNTWRVREWVLLFVVLLLCCCALSGCKDSKNSKPHSAHTDGNLHLRMETDFSKSEYVLGETVIVRLYLKNTTDKDIVVCAWPSKLENLFIFYENDKRIPCKDTVTFDRPVSKDKSFITVKSGAETHFATPQFGEEWQEEYRSKYFDKIGRWELKITHFYDFSGEHFGLNGWQGKLSSNVLSINVVPTK